MLNSSYRHRAVSGWLKENQPNQFSSELKLQKFLFFYEAQCEAEDGSASFDTLKGYKNGPVFSDVYGDNKHESYEFNQSVIRVFKENPESVDLQKAKLAGFLVGTMNEIELSALTHEFNIWKSKEHRIIRNERNVRLSKMDFGTHDASLINSFKEMYTSDFIDSVYVLNYMGKCLVIDKLDYSRLCDPTGRLSNEYNDVFLQLSQQDELINPVYLSLAEDGVILVD